MHSRVRTQFSGRHLSRTGTNPNSFSSSYKQTHDANAFNGYDTWSLPPTFLPLFCLSFTLLEFYHEQYSVIKLPCPCYRWHSVFIQDTDIVLWSKRWTSQSPIMWQTLVGGLLGKRYTEAASGQGWREEEIGEKRDCPFIRGCSTCTGGWCVTHSGNV